LGCRGPVSIGPCGAPDGGGLREVVVSRFNLALLAMAIVVTSGFPAAAQTQSVAPVTPSKSGLVSYIQGTVYLNDELLPDPLVGQFPYVKDKESVRTADGRAEVFMVPGLSVHLDARSSLRMISAFFEDTRAELTQGAAVVSTPEVDKSNNFTLVLGQAAVSIAKAGTYHFYADPARIKVFSGLAKVRIGERRLEVSPGKMLNLSGDAASLEKFDKDETDALDRWAARRGELMAAANLSSARNCNNSFGYVSNGRTDPCAGTWRWNPWFNIYTYIPYVGMWCDPVLGYCYYNPLAVMRVYRQPYEVYSRGGDGGGGGGGRTTQPSDNRPSAATRTVDSSNRPTSAPAAGSNSRGVERGSIGSGSSASSGGIGNSGMGGGSMGGVVSSGGGGVASGGGAAASGGGGGGGGGAVAGAGGGVGGASGK
jgi:hypothetical protein